MKKTIIYISNLNILPHIVKVMQTDNQSVLLPCLRILGGFISKTAMTTQQVVDSGALDLFPKLIGHPNLNIRKEIVWMISNIAAGTQLQLETLVSKGYLKILNKIMRDDENIIKFEAVWAICNFTLVDKIDLIKMIFADNIVETVCAILKMKQPKLIAVAIEAMTNLLKIGKNYFLNSDGSNPVAIRLEELGMIEYIESLQYHESEVVYEKIIDMIEKYLDFEDS